MPSGAPENNSSVTFNDLPPGAVPAGDPRLAKGNAEGQAGGNAGGTASSLIDKKASAQQGVQAPGAGHVSLVGEPNTQNTADGSAKPGDRAGGKDRQGAGGASL